MTLVFDASTMAFDEYWGLVFPGVAFLVTLYMIHRSWRLLWLWVGAAMTVVLFLGSFVLPLVDHNRVRAAAASADAMTVEGPIRGRRRETYRRFEGTSRGVGVTTTHRYRTVTTEEFWIGDKWFWFEVNGYPSRASFTNAGDPPLPLRDGTWAKATYFIDPWYQDQARIVRLSLRDMAVGGRVEKPDADFAVFWAGFTDAVGRGDANAARKLTRFPFLFAGTPLDAARFDAVWSGLFPPPLRSCLSQATPLRDGESWTVSCGVYVYAFEKGNDGWRFASFAADPEVM